MENQNYIIIKGAREHPIERLLARKVYILASQLRVYGASNFKGKEKNERFYWNPRGTRAQLTKYYC